MSGLKIVLQICAAISGVISAYYWIKSARVEVLAPNTSVGGVLGGGIHVKLRNGHVIDFHETYDRQSKYNALAAYAAAALAVLSAVLLLFP